MIVPRNWRTLADAWIVDRATMVDRLRADAADRAAVEASVEAAETSVETLCGGPLRLAEVVVRLPRGESLTAGPLHLRGGPLRHLIRIEAEAASAGRPSLTPTALASLRREGDPEVKPAEAGYHWSGQTMIGPGGGAVRLAWVQRWRGQVPHFSELDLSGLGEPSGFSAFTLYAQVGWASGEQPGPIREAAILLASHAYDGASGEAATRAAERLLEPFTAAWTA